MGKARLIVLVVVAFLTSFVHAQVATSTYASAEAKLDSKSLKAGEQSSLTVQFVVKPGFHAQSNKPLDRNYIPTKIKPLKSELIELGQIVYPPGVENDYPLLGRLSVYEETVQIKVPFKVKELAASGLSTVNLELTYQACNDQLCFPPETLKIPVEIQIAGGATTAPTTQPAPTTAPTTKDSTSSADPFAFLNTKAAGEAVQDRSVFQAFFIAVLAGLLFNVMPCVLPVLPLKVLGFYEASKHSRARAFLLGVVFSIGIISTFAVLAILILGLKQFQWGDLYSKGWFVWLIVGMITLLGLSLLLGQSVQLPTGVYNFNPRHDTVAGNYFWGILTTIFATPCTAPLFPGMLLWAYAQPLVIGVSSMLMVGVGMSLPYLILSAMPEVARKLPRVGAGSEVFKQMLGCLMIVSAGYFAFGRLIPGNGFWWAVFALIAGSSLFLIVRTIQLLKSVRAISISSFIAVVLVGLSLWWTLRITGEGQGIADHSSPTTRTDGHWLVYDDQTFIREVKSGHPVLVKFTANWCATCQVIEGTVFADQSIWGDLKSKSITAIKVDLTDEDAPGKNLLLKLNPAGGIPLTAIWFNPNENPIILDSVYTTSDLRKAIGVTGQPLP